MPITFGCNCGKQFTIADEFAGKRTKCPVCGSALTVPTPTNETELTKPASQEDEAYQMLMDGVESESEPAPALSRRDPAPDDFSQRPKPSTPASAPSRKQVPNFTYTQEDEYESRRGGGIHISPAVLGGMASMLIAVVWFGLGWSAGRIYFYPPVMFFFGLVAFVRGLFGLSED